MGRSNQHIDNATLPGKYFPVLTPPRYTIIIPVFNALDRLKRCLASLFQNTETQHPILVIDDASLDPNVGKYLSGLASKSSRIRFIRNAQNLGFVESCNLALEMVRGDVVLLNSDTIVAPHWLTRMDRCRRSNPKIGMVSPTTNGVTSPLLSPSKRMLYPRMAAAAGFCVLITAEARHEVGLFDRAFSPGYGEIHDYSFRAREKGFEIARCSDAFVYHEGAASFRSLPRYKELRLERAHLLSALWPEKFRNTHIGKSKLSVDSRV